MKIAVLRALQLGDLLCTVPALRALARAYPEAKISLIGLPWAAQFTERFASYVDEFIEFPGFPGLPERPCDLAALPCFLEEMQERRFDLLLQMHGSGRLTNPLAVAMGARRLAGFYLPGELCPDPERFFPWRDAEHEVLRWMRLLAKLGIPQQGTALEFPLTPEDWREWRRLGIAGKDYVCVHPGAQLPSRRWPTERFASVADTLAAEGLSVVLTGTAAEADLTRRVSQAMRARPLDLAGRTTLGAIGALIARARLLVCNDTGVSHIAAALGTPSVVVSSGADPRRWAPLDAARHRVLFHMTDCRPCAHVVCPTGHECALGVSAERVAGQARELHACAA